MRANVCIGVRIEIVLEKVSIHCLELVFETFETSDLQRTTKKVF